MKKPLVLYAIGERIGGQGLALVAQKAGEILFKNKMLESLLCYGYGKKNNSPIKIKQMHRIYFQPAKVFSFLPARYYYTMKRRWMDVMSSFYLRNSKANIFHGWTHSALRSIPIAKKRGMVTIVERGNSHPLHTKAMLEKEYEKYNIKSYHDTKNDNFFLRPFNLWRYEFNEALEELDICDYIFVNSNFCAETYSNYGIDKKKIIVIPRGFDPSIYSPRPSQKKTDKFILLFVGNLHVRKGIKYILEAWEALNLNNAELWFVGNVADEVKWVINKHLKKHSNIKTFGNVSNPVQFYKKASVFVFPSLDEGSAKVTYEAMACGLPCIFTDNAGSIADKNSAFIIPTKSSSAISKAVKKLYDDIKLRNEMGDKARRYIENFTWENYQNTLTTKYQEILGK
jgi:glycosyltransferase involved in cell wall biosynthesis